MHHDEVLQLLRSVLIDCGPAVGLSYLGIVLRYQTYASRGSATAFTTCSYRLCSSCQPFLSQDCAEGIRHSYASRGSATAVHIDCAPAVGCSYHLAVLQLSAVLTTRVCNSFQLSDHWTMLYSCQQFIPRCSAILWLH
jgi:hypothetical protein